MQKRYCAVAPQNLNPRTPNLHNFHKENETFSKKK